MLIKFAFRNVLRNKKRSFLTFLSIFLGAIIVGIAQGWINGMVAVYQNNFTKYQTGHVRITTEEYLKRQKFMPVDEIISDHEKLISKIEHINEIRDVQERVRFGILLGHKENTVSAFGIGINLNDNEYKLKEKLIEGEIKESGIYIGSILAKKAGVKIGDDLLIASKTSQGGLNGIKLKVEGIFKIAMMYDKNSFFISLEDAKRLLKIFNGTTELYVYGHDINNVNIYKNEISSFLPKGLTAQTYQEQLGDFMSLMETMKSVYIFIEALILFLACFVVINTMMMAIFERLHEIGTLKAMGMTDRQLFFNFTMEGAIIGTAGGILGAIVGYSIIAYLSHRGIDFSKEVKDLTIPIEYIIRPVIAIKDLAIAVIVCIVVPTVSAMIPARYARKLMPAEALRK
ncbi:MAG: FtsX-like permease family protein [Spirochaetia bacterium]|nr:FtsX-like permease family protein [Spirochaetia bacterium]